MDFLKTYIANKYKEPNDKDKNETLDRIGRPTIPERRICIDFDNTWRSSGNKTFISLTPPSKNGTYRAVGYAEVHDFIIDPKVALTFKIEFRLDLPTKDKKKREDVYFSIAWGYFLPNYKENGELIPGSIDLDFQLGPGTAPDGKPLWTPDPKDVKDFKLTLFASLTPRGNFDPTKIDVKVRSTPPHLDIKPSINDRMFSEIEKTKGDSSMPLESQKVPAHLIKNSREMREYEEKLRLEQRINKNKEDEIKSLEDKVKRVQNQLFDKERNSLTDKSYDSKITHHERERNKRDLEEKYQQKLENIKKEFEQKQERLEQELEKKYGGREDKDGRLISPPRYETRRREDRGPYDGRPAQLPYSSSYLADPSYTAPSFYPPDDKSRLIGHSRYVDEDLKILPPPPLVPIELPTSFDLTRDDEIAFIKLGIRDDILRHDTLDEPEIEIEIRNPLKSSEFIFKFIAFKPPLAMPFGQKVPRRMYFKFNFFTFCETTSESCEIKDPEGKSDLTHELIPGQQYLLDKIGKSRLQDFSSVECEFIIDSSVSKIHDENIEFYKYLFERDLSIDVYDADSHLHYGTCRVNLRSMLKQTRSGVVRARDCEIAAFESSNRSITGAVNMGYLQLLMSHQGKKESVTDYNFSKGAPEDDNRFLEERKQPSQKHKFNKKVKSRPIHAINEEYIASRPDDIYGKVIEDQFNIEDEESEEIKKKMRIERVKNFKFKQQIMSDQEARMKNTRRNEEALNVVADPSKPEWVKNQSLRQIETLRNYNKPHVIEKVLKDHIKSLKQMHIIPGTPSFFKYTLKNPFSAKTVFTVNIIDPDKIFLGESKEFKLVNGIEWEFWYSKKE